MSCDSSSYSIILPPLREAYATGSGAVAATELAAPLERAVSACCPKSSWDGDALAELSRAEYGPKWRANSANTWCRERRDAVAEGEPAAADGEEAAVGDELLRAATMSAQVRFAAVRRPATSTRSACNSCSMCASCNLSARSSSIDASERRLLSIRWFNWDSCLS